MKEYLPLVGGGNVVVEVSDDLPQTCAHVGSLTRASEGMRCDDCGRWFDYEEVSRLIEAQQ